LKEKDYKDNALASFKTALKCASNEMSILNATQLLLEQKQVGFRNSDLYKQLNVKTVILGSYISGINGCIVALKRTKRLIDVVVVTKHTGDIGILEATKHFNGQERNEDNTTEFKGEDLKLKNNERYSLTFNHLTTCNDGKTNDQALITLQHAFDESILEKEIKELSELERLKRKAKDKIGSSSECCLDESYSYIQIKLKQVDLAVVSSAIFNPDKEFRDLTRKTAIATLKEERSYWHASGLGDSHDANLTISSIDERKLNLEFKNKKINDVIKIIDHQKLSDAALRFDIVIKQGNQNKINKLFMSNGRSPGKIELNIDFDNLSRDVAKAKLSSIEAESFDIEFVLNKSELLRLIQSNDKLESGSLYISEKHMFEKVKREELLRRVGELKTDDSPCYVKFEKLCISLAKYVVKSCHENVSFAVSFFDIKDYYCSDINDGQVNIGFDKLNRNTAEIVINVLRENNIEFSLEFKDLSNKQVRFILKNASLTQEDMKINKVKGVSDLFMKSATPTRELNEFATKGMEYILEISEKLSIPWMSVGAIAALGVGQVVIGGWLMCTGYGSTVGMSLVTEGLADIFIAYRAYSKRQFQWNDYCKQKAISLAISVTSMGFSKWMEGAQSAAKGIEILSGAGKEVVEQGCTQLVSNRKTVIELGENLMSLMVKLVTTKAGEAVARECLNTGIQYLSNFSFDLLRSKICESIQSNVSVSFYNTELIGLLRKMYAIDLASKSPQLQSRLEKIVSEALNPRHDFVRRQWESIGLPLIKGVLSDSSKYGSTASMAIRIAGTLEGLYAVQGLVNYVVDTLFAKLKVVD